MADQIRNTADVYVGSAMRIVLSGLPGLRETRMSTGPSEGRFDKSVSTLVGTWWIRIRKDKTNEAKDESDEKRAESETFEAGNVWSPWVLMGLSSSD